jgi:hypothetical protein
LLLAYQGFELGSRYFLRSTGHSLALSMPPYHNPCHSAQSTAYARQCFGRPAFRMAVQKEKLDQADPLPHLDRFFMGQEVFFLGFPYGLAEQVDSVHWTAPFVKHAYTSAVMRCSDIDAGFPSDSLSCCWTA